MTTVDSINSKFMGPRAANHVPLSPLSFIKRTAAVYGNKPATTYNGKTRTWSEVYARCCLFASAVKKIGVRRGEVISVLAFNTPEMVELQFAVAMAGGVLNTINTRLDKDTIAGIIAHAEPAVIVVDAELTAQLELALTQINRNEKKLIVIPCPEHEASRHHFPEEVLYDDFLESGDPDDSWSLPESEWEAYGLNYTSGTGGTPKGVVIHHRGAYLMAMGTVPAWGVPQHPVYLYTVPMFHCNGWGHAWLNALVAGSIICVKKISAKIIFDAISEYRVTHFGGAPVILGLLINAPAIDQKTFKHSVQVMTAGAPPPPAVLEKVEQLGMEIMQVYGLTETFGHIMHCAWNTDWDDLDFGERATIKARQGVQFTHTEETEVLGLADNQPVPHDGKTQGEIVIRSNTLMKGYHKDEAATEAVFKDDKFFRTGDIAVRHPDGYIEIKDRLKDVIISGGENISSVEVENVLYRLPGVACAAVVAKPSEKWGEVPVAVIELKADTEYSETEIIDHCRRSLAGFKTPKEVIFREIPKTATGKVQKFLLRQELNP